MFSKYKVISVNYKPYQGLYHTDSNWRTPNPKAIITFEKSNLFGFKKTITKEFDVANQGHCRSITDYVTGKTYKSIPKMIKEVRNNVC